MTVAEINALLYLPGHSRQQLERALRIPALSAGWRGSFQALFKQESSGGPVTGNPGLAAGGGTPAWAGFRRLRVSRMTKSRSVISLLLVPVDRASSLLLPSLGQFVVLRLRRTRMRHRCYVVTRSLTRQAQITIALA